MTPRQHINDAGLAIITSSESFAAKPYLCPARVWTNGWGHTQGVTATTAPITEAEGHAFLLADIQGAELAVARLVNVPLTSNQYAALVSLVFNIGSGRFQSSTLRMRLNRGDYAGAADQFRVWRMGGGKVLRGLVTRRARETSLFNTRDPKKPQPGPLQSSGTDAIVAAINAATAQMQALTA